MSSSSAGSRPRSDFLRASTVAIADSPPPPISPSPTSPSSVSISTTVRTNRPQWHPFAWRSGASSGTVTVVARTSLIFTVHAQHSGTLALWHLGTLAPWLAPAAGRRTHPDGPDVHDGNHFRRRGATARTGDGITAPDGDAVADLHSGLDECGLAHDPGHFDQMMVFALHVVPHIALGGKPEVLRAHEGPAFRVGTAD